MPDLPQSAAEVEKIVRDALVVRFTGIPGLPFIFPHRLWIDGEAHAVRTFSFQENGKREYRVLIIDFAGFSDTDAGCDDNPVYRLLYTLKLSVLHVDKRTDNSTSTDSFAALTFALRERCLPTPEQRHLADYSQLTIERLRQNSSTFQVDDDTLIFGHHATFSLGVEVNPSGAN